MILSRSASFASRVAVVAAFSLLLAGPRSQAQSMHFDGAIRLHGSAAIDPAVKTGSASFETAKVGKRVRLYQAVTLGAKRFPVGENGALVKGNARHPIIEDDVVIYAGATILGRVTIGRGSTIGGNVWITRDVPPNSSVSQALARGDAFDEGGGI